MVYKILNERHINQQPPEITFFLLLQTHHARGSGLTRPTTCISLTNSPTSNNHPLIYHRSPRPSLNHLSVPSVVTAANQTKVKVETLRSEDDTVTSSVHVVTRLWNMNRGKINVLCCEKQESGEFCPFFGKCILMGASWLELSTDFQTLRCLLLIRELYKRRLNRVRQRVWALRWSKACKITNNSVSVQWLFLCLMQQKHEEKKS